ncbi:hypothetical protein [Nannocystis pusilla]|uniref:hypothetical protein n=1 Tax=Nannocystis pusilla TaxID=889268 RepID=UPI003B7EC5ED
MANRKNEARLNLIVGLFVLGLGAVGVLSIFIIGQGKGTWKEKGLVYADFRQVSGLKKAARSSSRASRSGWCRTASSSSSSTRATR